MVRMGFSIWGAGLLVAVGLSSCGNTTHNYLSKHVLPVEEDGGLGRFAFQDPAGEDGERPARGQDLASHIELLLDAAEADRGPGGDLDPNRPVPLLVHLHGGRKSLTASARTSDDILTAMRSGAGHQPGDPWWYPIFVHWPSDDVRAAWARLTRLRLGRDLDTCPGLVTMPFVFAHDLARGIVRLPLSLPVQIFRDASVASQVALGSSPLETWQQSAAIVEAMHADPDATDRFRLSDPHYHRSVVTHAARLLCYFPSQVFKIPVQATFLEGLGQGAWDEMRRRAHNLVWPTETFEAEREGVPASETRASLSNAAAAGALPQLFRAIARRERPYELMLVAHSMGAIAINNVLPALTDAIESAEGRMRVKRIVYMAPACSVIEAADSLVPFLHASKETQFHLLTLHPVAEADEINAFDVVPRGSLLEWIDNFYTNPATHSERVFGKWANAVPALNLFASVRNQVHFKAFDVEGDSFPQAHGQFHSIPFWSPKAFEVDGARTFEADWLTKTCERCGSDKGAEDDRPKPW